MKITFDGITVEQAAKMLEVIGDFKVTPNEEVGDILKGLTEDQKRTTVTEVIGARLDRSDEIAWDNLQVHNLNLVTAEHPHLKGVSSRKCDVCNLYLPVINAFFYDHNGGFKTCRRCLPSSVGGEKAASHRLEVGDGCYGLTRRDAHQGYLEWIEFINNQCHGLKMRAWVDEQMNLLYKAEYWKADGQSYEKVQSDGLSDSFSAVKNLEEKAPYLKSLAYIHCGRCDMLLPRLRSIFAAWTDGEGVCLCCANPAGRTLETRHDGSQYKIPFSVANHTGLREHIVLTNLIKRTQRGKVYAEEKIRLENHFGELSGNWSLGQLPEKQTAEKMFSLIH